MNRIDRRRYDMLVRVKEFANTYGHLFPGSSPALPAFATVHDAVAQVARSDIAETTASVAARAEAKAAARAALVDLLGRIEQIAGVLDDTNPALAAPFAVPSRAGDQELVNTARRIAQEAAPLSEQFVAHGLPRPFIADLEARAAAFEEALRRRGSGRKERVAAREQIKAALASGLAAVRKLDVIVHNQLAADPVTRAVWKDDRRVDNPYRARPAAATEAVAAGPPVAPVVRTDAAA